MQTRQTLLTVAIASLYLAGCDSVKFPGFTSTEATPSSPEQASTSGSDPTNSPATGTLELDTTDVGLGDTPDETAAPAPQPIPSEPTQPETPSFEFLGINNLLAINAARCASSGETTMTLAEVANADIAAANVTAQAINGVAVSSASFPGIVKMEPRRTLSAGSVSSGHCGATRIAENWFVTASHCLDDTYDEIRLISTDSNLRDPRAIVFEADATLCHSAYGGASGQYANDVALVGISDETASTLTNIPIARFGETERALGPVNYPVVRMAGWGLTSFERGELSDTLLRTDLSLVSSGPAAITVASTNEAGPCIGDSGGPLLVDEEDGNPRVIGVLSVVEQNRSSGKFCEGDYNARYTNLAGYTGWIETVIGVCTANPGLCAR